jgi:hypothetical protein
LRAADAQKRFDTAKTHNGHRGRRISAYEKSST